MAHAAEGVGLPGRRASLVTAAGVQWAARSFHIRHVLPALPHTMCRSRRWTACGVTARLRYAARASPRCTALAALRSCCPRDVVATRLACPVRSFLACVPCRPDQRATARDTPGVCAAWRHVLQVLAVAKNVLGYFVVNSVACLLLAHSVRTTAVLPGGHEVKTVSTTRWHKLPLQVGAVLCRRPVERQPGSLVPRVLHTVLSSALREAQGDWLVGVHRLLSEQTPGDARH